MSGSNVNFALKSICQQRAKQLSFNTPLPRYEVISPYNGIYNQQQLDMRRKAEILKYSNNSSSTKTNNLSKSQKWSQIVKGNANSQIGNFPSITVTTLDYLGKYNTIIITYPDTLQSIPTTQYIIDGYGNSILNPTALQIVGNNGYFNVYIIRGSQSLDCNKNLILTPTSACDVPGPVTYLIDDDSVPLYNYATKVNSYSYDSTTIKDAKWLFNPTSDILLTNGENTNVLSLLITDKIDQSSYNFTLQIPFSMYVTGTNISANLIYDSINNKLPDPSYFPNAYIGLQSIHFGVNYNNKAVSFESSPKIELFTNGSETLTSTNGTYLMNNQYSLQFDISFNEQIDKNAPLGPVSTTDSYTAKLYTGVISISNIILLTSPGFVYDFVLQMNTTNIQFPSSARSEIFYYPTAIQTTHTGVYANVSSNESVQDNCTVYPPSSSPLYKKLTLFAS